MNNPYENYCSFRKCYLQNKSPKENQETKQKPPKPPNKYMNLRAVDQNEVFLPGGIYSVFNIS